MNVGINAHIYKLPIEKLYSPPGANTLKAARAANTDGAIYDNQRIKTGGNSNDEKKATGNMRGSRETADTPNIINQIVLLFTNQHPNRSRNYGGNNNVRHVMYGRRPD
jgi:hypothetical protein